MAVPVWIWAIICPTIAYFIGSIPFSFIITKLKTGKDLRKVGTKNVGGLNTMVQTSMGVGMLAGFFDFLKGLICILSVVLIPFDDTPLFGNNPRWQLSWHSIIFILVGMFVIIGHNYTVFLGFKGGRGIAASVGILMIVNPLFLLIFASINGLVTVITKYVRPAQFVAFFLTLPIAFFLPLFPPWIVAANLTSGLTFGLLYTGIMLACLPKYTMPFINVFRGKEYKIGEKGLTSEEVEEQTR